MKVKVSIFHELSTWGVDEMFPLLEHIINVSDDDITSYLKLYEMKSLKNKK